MLPDILTEIDFVDEIKTLFVDLANIAADDLFHKWDDWLS